ncbi:MAG: hypothetical protein KDD60_06700, partial [Bdellovibrionales bacterium]|nr:hypothetical protein [Bdellovibrionales bacterium]
MTTSANEAQLFSMTGFARNLSDSQYFRITVEVRALNSRYLDCSVRLPRELLQVESTIRSVVSELVGRGRIEISVVLERNPSATIGMRACPEWIGGYLSACREVAESEGVWGDDFKRSLLLQLLQRREAVIETGLSGGNIEDASVVATVRECLESLRTEQRVEGEALYR